MSRTIGAAIQRRNSVPAMSPDERAKLERRALTAWRDPEISRREWRARFKQVADKVLHDMSIEDLRLRG